MDKDPWEKQAACSPQNRTVDLDWFSSDADEKYAARAVCQSMCSVRKECLQSALDFGSVDGIWGGVDDYEIRRAMSVDAEGKPSRRSRPPRCPFCTSKDISVTQTRIGRGYYTECNNCELHWYMATLPLKYKTKKVA